MTETLRPAMTLGERFVNALPTVGLVLLCLIVGLGLSAMLARGVRWLVRRSGLETLSEQFGASRLLYAAGLQAGVAVQLGRIAFLAGGLVTLLTAAELAGLTTVADALMGVVGYVPQALVAFVLLVVGLRLADVARTMVTRASGKGGLFDAPEVVGAIVYYAVLIFAGTLVADQLGLETDLLNGLIQIAVAAVTVGLTLSFALGARGVLSHVVARIYLSRVIRPGDVVRVTGQSGPIDGEVVRFAPAVMLIRAQDGQEHLVPCGRLLDEVVGLRRVDAARVAPAGPAPADSAPADEKNAPAE